MEKKNFKQEVIAYMLLILGSALFAVGDVMFVNPYLMAPGGTYGLSNVFSTLWGGKISVWAICMDVPLLIIGTWVLGPKFGVKTIISTFLIFGFTYAIESWVWGYNPVIHDGPIVANAIEGLNMVQTHDGMWFVPDYFLNTARLLPQHRRRRPHLRCGHRHDIPQRCHQWRQRYHLHDSPQVH